MQSPHVPICKWHWCPPPHGKVKVDLGKPLILWVFIEHQVCAWVDQMDDIVCQKC